MKRLLIPTLSAYTFVGFLSGGILLVRIHKDSLRTLADDGALLFVFALALSPILAISIAVLGPRRPEGLLRLEDPYDAQARDRARSRLKVFLRVIGVAFAAGLFTSVWGGFGRNSSWVGGFFLACAGCLMVLLAPWIALYARWFRIDWF